MNASLTTYTRPRVRTSNDGITSHFTLLSRPWPGLVSDKVMLVVSLAVLILAVVLQISGGYIRTSGVTGLD